MSLLLIRPKEMKQPKWPTRDTVIKVSLLIMVRGQSVSMSNVYSLSEDIMSLLL